MGNYPEVRVYQKEIINCKKKKKKKKNMMALLDGSGHSTRVERVLEALFDSVYLHTVRGLLIVPYLGRCLESF